MCLQLKRTIAALLSKRQTTILKPRMDLSTTVSETSQPTDLLNTQFSKLNIDVIADKDNDFSHIVVPTANEDPDVPLKNKAVTKPVELNSATGEVLVRKATGKTKLRKGQTEDEYQLQKKIYLQDNNGPVRKEEGWLDLTNDNVPTGLDMPKECILDKQKRSVLNSRVTYLYYKRDYANAHKISSELIKLYSSEKQLVKLTKRDIKDLEYIQKLSSERL